jgi:aldehyde:ferredoxin oxidoreductase
MIFGYMGSVLWVDLSRSQIREEALDGKLCREYIGGYGLGAKILFNQQKPGVDPLGPENTLGFVTGPLAGTQALGASRYVVVGKSPLTGTWGDANSGGNFGPYLKFAGYDAVFFTGIAPKPVYLFIDNGKAEIKEATHLWGKDCYETEDILKNEMGKDIELACIGPAGEKMSLIAAIVNNKGRAAARSGLGAVMGSKKLKAVVIRGNLKVPLFDEAKISALRKQYIPQLAGPIDSFRKYGTSNILSRLAKNGDAPVKNWSGASVVDFPQFEKIAGDAVIEQEEKKYACYRCVVGCGGYMKAGTGDYKYPAGVHKPEYETLAMFGTSCLNDNIDSIIASNDICNRYGLDTISAGATIAFAIECYENGLITKKDTDGIEMTWGNHKSIVTMVDKLARREGFGAMLADGSKVAAGKIGKGAEQYAMNIQGQEYGAHDPRKGYNFAAGYRFDATPGRHTRDSGMAFKGLEKPQFDANSYAGRAAAQKIGMSFFHIIDCSGSCHFVTFTYPSANVLIEFLNAATGWDLTMEEVLKTGERIANIRHCFNIREGLNFLKFNSPGRMAGKPPLTAGPIAGKTIDEEMIAREFCEVMDWDKETTKPSKKKLSELGMDDVAKIICD